MQQELLRSSRDRLEAELGRAQRSVLLWSALLLFGIGAVITSALVVRRRVVQPLEGLSDAMLKLADNDLTTPLPRLTRADEIGAMNDALRVFKANAIQRQRAQNEKQLLHARLRDAYRQLRKDLEAAAVIQSTMLPAASTLGDVRYRGLFRPSSLIAGDTYNVVRRTDGGIASSRSMLRATGRRLPWFRWRAITPCPRRCSPGPREPIWRRSLPRSTRTGRRTFRISP
jgi:HAMP domain-containing protein